MSDPSNRITRSTSSPLQLPGRDTIVAESVLGGPDAMVDARMILSRADLEQLLDVARSSLTGRVVLNRCGVKVRLYRRGDGHHYEVWSLVAGSMVAEQSPIIAPDGTAKLRIG